MKIMVVEDDDALRELITDYLEAKGIEVTSYPNGLAAYHNFMNDHIDLALLDVMMPEMDGFELCEKIKEISNIPVIFITARMLEDDQLKGYELGCDDYIIKPFSLPVLFAKIKAIIKRNQLESTIQYGPIVWNQAEKVIYLNQQVLKLQDLDYKLLTYFLMNPDHLLTREQILNHVWGLEKDVVDRSVDTHIKQIRKQLGQSQYCIKTIIKQGYRFETEGLKS